MSIIGISGKIGSGKDLSGQIINYLSTVDHPSFIEFRARHVYSSQLLGNPKYEYKKFADKIKDTLCLWLGCTREQLENRKYKEASLGPEWDDLTPRKILQLLGTEYGRKIIHPNIWVNSLFSDYKENSNWIITDVRFPNEVEGIKNRGGKVFRIERSIALRSHYRSEDDLLVNGTVEDIHKYNHTSETSLDGYKHFDDVLTNSGSLEKLYNLWSYYFKRR